MIFFGEDMLRTTIREFMAHRLLAPVEIIATGVVQKRERLGGLLNYYYREAA